MGKKEVRISKLGTLHRDVNELDILPIVADGKTHEVSVKELLRTVFKVDDSKLDSVTGWSSEKIAATFAESGIEEAPVDGTQYARQDAGWSTITIDPTTLVDADIGVTVQGYDLDTVIAPLGILPILDGSNLTGVGGSLTLDNEMRYTAVTDMVYTSGDLTQMVYGTGNVSNYIYTGTDLTQITYTDTDGLTILLTLDYGYDVNGDLDTITRT